MKKYALVEWTNEADAGSYSVVKSEWILGYTPEMYLIEWREGQGRKKPPPGGWPMGEAKILQTSDKEVELKRQLHTMTSVKEQSNLVVTGKRKRIPKKRLYESDDETDTDACRSSSGDEKKRLKGRNARMGLENSSPSTPRRGGMKKSLQAQNAASSCPEQDQDQDQDELGKISSAQNAYQEMSSEREVEESTDDIMEEGRGNLLENMMDDAAGMEEEEEEEEEEESETDYPPEYELSELEKLRMEVRGLRDEIMLLRHQVCKELPKVHAIALKALGVGMHGNGSYAIEPQSTTPMPARPVAPSSGRGHHRRGRKSANIVRPSNVLKKETELFRQKVKSENQAVNGVKAARNEKTSASSPGRRAPGQKPSQVEIHPGTGVFIDREDWEKLNELDQPTAFARRMLPYVFSMETLLNSNLRGGRSTRDTKAEPKLALDQERVDAIYKSVITKFPNVSYCDIGQAINGRLSSIRYREQKRQARLMKQK
ncbi:uncharacterized protein [Diadema setosum]|uniref:uncharacterized protein isoform X1 n=1 Tax=Diadema setosum TaxID=31175 RepID=UPI003B3B58D8